MSDDDDDEVKYNIKFEGDENEKGYNAIDKDGMATATFGNGDTFTGMYKDRKRNGKGTYKFKNGAEYSGDYVNNLKEGEGKMTFTDGGIYTGEWKMNERYGFGTYLYPNGDTYTGMWKNGKKHGKGTYTYVDIGSSITGDWVANKCVTGEWTMHDQSKYIGRFANNVPAGNGMFSFANKNTQAGNFTENQWKADSFVAPSPIAPLPKPVKATPFTWACRAIEKSLLIVDHYEGIVETKSAGLEGIPNFRRAEKFPVWGGGQPTISGLKAMMEALGDEETAKVFFVSLRDTPVCYVNDLSFTCAARNAISRPMVFPEIDMAEYPKLDDCLAEKMKVEIKATGGIMSYWKLAYADVEEDVKKVDLVMEVEPVQDEEEDDDDPNKEAPLPIMTPDTMFQPEGWLEKNGLDIQYQRMCIPENTIPSLATVDQIITLSKEIGDDSGVFFCDQGGLKRTTTGMILASLVRKTQEQPEDDDGDGDDGDDDDDFGDPPSDVEDVDAWLQDQKDARAAAKAAEAARLAAMPKEPNYKMGEYKMIDALVAGLPGGEDIKKDVDEVIDRNGEIYNAREQIFDLKQGYDQTQDADVLAMGKNYVERYAWYFVIYVFLKQAMADPESEVTFAQWIAEETQVTMLQTYIGTRDAGPLSAFDFS